MPNPFINTMIRMSGRPWWQARFSDGRILAEWQTLNVPHLKLPLPYDSAGGSSRWEEVDKKGMVGLRLLCPNGMAAELEAGQGCQFFQLKHGRIDIGFGPGAPSRRYTDAYVIGIIRDGNTGECYCRAWEVIQDSLNRKGEIELAIGRLRTIMAIPVNDTPANRRQERRLLFKLAAMKEQWHLIGFFDNIFNMKYKDIGPLKLEVQGMRI